MQKTTSPAGWAGLAGGVASAVVGAIQAVRVEDFDPVVNRTEHVMLGLFAVALVLWIPAYLKLGRLTGTRAGWIGGCLAAFGCALLAFGSTSTNLHDQDYAWFSVVAVPANAAWLIGSLILAVVCWRRRVLPRWLAVGLALVWVTSIILSQAGGNLVAGLIWGIVGWLMIVRDREPAAAADDDARSVRQG
ncbi:hypothetical protein [Paractinoplanes rishiriensis]|uniref:Uncharacterized protein n=1 Tax=Paractinoplanes rishiriensis TaxID=1050105 RepID=A0A919JYJ2_9ACTN|nr:hypothetical protein [Actinoplanes rishiriensis]GIE97591.1 hypothetical protein Ari01nite_50560 [Actinoplanes rishiriensis]